MMYLDPFYTKSLARYAMIDKDSSQTITKSLCPPFSSFFAQIYDLAGYRLFTTE